MSPRWGRESAHPTDDTITSKTDVTASSEEPITGPRCANALVDGPDSGGPNVLDDNFEDEGPRGFCTYRGGKLIITINLRGETKGRTRVEPTTRTEPSGIVSMETNGSNLSQNFPSIHRNNGMEIAKLKTAENSNAIARGFTRKSAEQTINDRLKNMNMDFSHDNTICGDAFPPRVQQTIDAFETTVSGLFVDDVTIRCIILNCRITNNEALDLLWKQYEDGSLQEKLKRHLELSSNDDSFRDVSVCISRHDYVSCKHKLTEQKLLHRLGNTDIKTETCQRSNKKAE
ncbi:hypothetical protein BSL78_29305 [Apostichopus japonicus]|uniref:Uncharacterized protein n=1 Tax=Stichopus japonicus TaxID=307972 RepID=A0A2G8JDP7_STIJA|nr:hypothetical protein BSL78_29305 [Apostichopus japonicus]